MLMVMTFLALLQCVKGLSKAGSFSLIKVLCSLTYLIYLCLFFCALYFVLVLFRTQYIHFISVG